MNPDSLMEKRYLIDADPQVTDPQVTDPRHEVIQLTAELQKCIIQRNVWVDRVKTKQLEIDKLQNRKLQLETMLCKIQHIPPTPTPRKVSRMNTKQNAKFSPANLLAWAKQGKLKDFISHELGI